MVLSLVLEPGVLLLHRLTLDTFSHRLLLSPVLYFPPSYNLPVTVSKCRKFPDPTFIPTDYYF